MTDSIIVGQFTGKIGLAAINSVATLFKFPLNFMNGLASGAAILISRSYGARDRKDLLHSVHAALTVAAGLGIVFSIGGVLLTPWLMNVMSIPEDIRAPTELYCRIFSADCGPWSCTT